MRLPTRWYSRGACLGLGLGVLLAAIGAGLSAWSGDTEPLDTLTLLLSVVTVPFSLPMIAMADRWPNPVLWTVVFLVAPTAQGALIGALAALVRHWWRARGGRSV